jgi:ornithine cyclodeaminase/alanine dehydrogenase-like protein (mu-crystallin family)
VIGGRQNRAYLGAPVLAIVGAGVQGEHHLKTFRLVRDFEDIRIASLHAERLAAGHPRARAATIAEPSAAPTSSRSPPTPRSR